jgi:hypothetical protein
MSTRGRRAHRPEQSGPPEYLWILLVLAAALIGGLAAATLVHASLIIAVAVSVVAAGVAVLILRMSLGHQADLPRGQATYGPGPLDGPNLSTHLSPDESRSPGPHADAGPHPGAGPRFNTGPPASAVPLSGPHAVPGPLSGADPNSAAAMASSDPGYGSGRQTDPEPGRLAETVVQMLPLPPQPGEPARPAEAPWWDSAPGAPPRPSAAAKRAPAPDLTTYLASTFIAQCPSCGAFRLDIRQARDAWDFWCEACEYSWTWQPGTAWPPVRVMPGRRRELCAAGPWPGPGVVC